MKKRLSTTSIVLTIVLVTVILVILIMTGKTNASPAPLLDDQVLTQKAIEEARGYGLSGEPLAQRSVHMDLAKWTALTNAGLGSDAGKFGLTPDLPVFVLAIQGSVEWKGPGLPQPGQSSPEKYNNITIVLNAQNGELIWAGSYLPGYPMPVSVP